MVPSRRLHILVDYRPALRQRTGVGEYVHHLTNALLGRLGPADRVTLFSASWKDRLEKTTLPGVARTDVRLPVRVLNFTWHRLNWPPVEMFGVNPDVTWSLHPLAMPSRAAASVVTVHDLFFLDHPERTRAEIRRDYPALAARHVSRADAVIVNSDYTRDAVSARLGAAADRITVCYPGRPHWGPRKEPAAPGPILHVGTIEPRKNLAALVRAYARLVSRVPAAPPLVLAGRLPAPLASLGIPPDLASRVQLRGYVSEEEKLALYRQASMLVIPSSDEGFGIPALEGMSIGLPVIAAHRGSLPEVLGEAGLLVDVDNAVVLSQAMARVLEDAALRAELRTRGLERARAFDWSRSAEHLLFALRKAWDQRRRR